MDSQSHYPPLPATALADLGQQHFAPFDTLVRSIVALDAAGYAFAIIDGLPTRDSFRRNTGQSPC